MCYFRAGGCQSTVLCSNDTHTRSKRSNAACAVSGVCVSVAAAVAAEYVARERHNIIYVCNCFACTRATHTLAAYNTIIKCKCLLRNGKHQQFNHVPNGVSSRAQHTERTAEKTKTESKAPKNFNTVFRHLFIFIDDNKKHTPRIRLTHSELSNR